MVKLYPISTIGLVFFSWCGVGVVSVEAAAWKPHHSILDRRLRRRRRVVHQPAKRIHRHGFASSFTKKETAKPLHDMIRRRKLEGHDDGGGGNNDEPDDVPFVVLYDGVWTNRWYGEALIVPSAVTPNVTGSFDYYSETEVSCVLEEVGLTLEGLAKGLFPLFSWFVDNTTVKYTDPFAFISDFFLTYSPNGEAGCMSGVTPGVGDDDYERDPVLTYKIFRQWFLEQYPFFDKVLEGGYDEWFNFTDSLTPQTSDNVTDQELFDIMKQSVTPLGGPPVVAIYANVGEYFVPFHPFTEELNKEYEESLETEGGRRYLNETDEDHYEEGPDEQTLYRRSVLEAWREIVESEYLDTMSGDLDITYGTILNEDDSCRVGYINYVTFAADNYDGWQSQVAAAHTAVKDCSSLLLDVRFNPGAYTTDALLAASHLFAEATQFFSVRTILRNTADGSVAYSPLQDIYVDPPEDTSVVYDKGPVVVLMSGSTAGAGETFVGATRAADATLMGQRTIGAFGNQWYYMLPNGWWIGMSMEEIFWPDDGVQYEGIGFPVDIELTRECVDAVDQIDIVEENEDSSCGYISPWSKEDRENGVDTWLEEAIEYITGLLPNETPVETSTPTVTPSNGAAGVSWVLVFAGVLVCAWM